MIKSIAGLGKLLFMDTRSSNQRFLGNGYNFLISCATDQDYLNHWLANRLKRLKICSKKWQSAKPRFRLTVNDVTFDEINQLNGIKLRIKWHNSNHNKKWLKIQNFLVTSLTKVSAFKSSKIVKRLIGDYCTTFKVITQSGVIGDRSSGK